MSSTAQEAFRLLRKIKSVTFATVNNGLPDARIIDVMLAGDDGLYFLTGRGKPFYRQLAENGKVAVCGMDENYVTARIVGDIRQCGGRETIDKIFEHNPMMNDLYPGESREILEAFHLYRGKGEIFNLSVEPPSRKRFAFGGESVHPSGFRITDACVACGQCRDVCPVSVISEGEPYVIDGSHCLECGRCAENCPADAIRKSSGM